MRKTPATGPLGMKHPGEPMKSANHSATTAKIVAPHPEQVPTLLKQLMDKSIPVDDALIINEPASTATESSTRPLTLVKHM